MNFKVMLGFGLLAMSAAMAQDETAAVAAPVVAPITAAPAPAAKATTASAGVFDGVRGSAFNSVGNEAAPSTIDDYLARPSNFGGVQMLYIEPAGQRGLVSFGTDRTFFAQFDNSEDLGRLTLGMANKGGWGLEIGLALGQWHRSDDAGSSGLTNAGDDWRARFSTPMDGYTLAFGAEWYTYADETSSDPDKGSKTDASYNDFSLNGNLTNAPSAGAYTWTLGLDVGHIGHSTTVGSKTTDDGALASTVIAPYFNIGAQVLGNEKAHVFIGANNCLPVRIADGYDSTKTGAESEASLFELGLRVSPNILGEVAVTDNFIVFGEAAYNWLVFGFGSGSTGEKTASSSTKADYTVFESHSYTAMASAGLRYQKDNRYAIEFELGDKVFTDTKAIFNGEGTFVTFGGFLYF
jgi:hypothetical protein